VSGSKFKYLINNFHPEMLCGRQSEAGQDLFVIALTQGKREGTFLEIGCNDDYRENNTWLLEKLLGWSGVSMDLPGGAEYAKMWGMHRPNSQLITANATEYDYSILPDYFDYLQIDIAPPSANLSVLTSVLKTQEFGLITYEHDAWDNNGESQDARNIGRELLEKAGYVMIAGDIALPVHRRFNPEFEIYFEDWWANPKYIDKAVIDAYRTVEKSDSLTFFYDVLFESTASTRP
jgi:hypothetical protein